MAEAQTFTTLEERISSLEEQINKITLKEKSLEIQKSWSTSLTRIAMNSITTYIFVAVLMFILKIDNYLINALIPALAYGVSVQSIPFVKKLWIRDHLKDDRKEKEEIEENTGKVFK